MHTNITSWYLRLSAAAAPASACAIMRWKLQPAPVWLKLLFFARSQTKSNTSAELKYHEIHAKYTVFVGTELGESKL